MTTNKKIKVLQTFTVNELVFIDVPEEYTDFKIVNYGYAGTYLMETNSTGLNNWKTKIPNGQYDILGFTNAVIIDTETKEEIQENFVLRKIK